ncbi:MULTISPECIES: hypothetical protein [Okeania]|uniref:DUF4403 family protein n=1 Tax=Okeania hirsuta TaxID=1458930 RepID=A0A3N6PPK4_9CYAN|nr:MULTISPECIES: hypothetical protein [Okeania]NET15322.1 hypothetical protein [Okeania sp. SIO1H6]NES77526.1 hypothetical protein [Okeania sp. SIO1H4]NES92040.1 hypothetical protein [Okeania sp. SIO2B9]NET18596.1 hypothetical protein [Okeania sp. SIO1H5]NET78678.1 hypothetical protein [Okeania sp. SIO1F9]
MNLQRFLAAPVAFGLTLGTFYVLNLPAYAKTVNVTVPKTAVAIAFNTAFSSTKVHLDNYGKKHGSSWHQDSSYVLLPNGAKESFLIPEYKHKVTKFRQLKYYIDNMNTSSIQATINGSRIQATARFESQGEEIKAKCVRRRFGKWGECKLKMERDIHLNNSILSMSLIPVAYNGSISYANPKVDFKTDLRIPNKLCQAFKGICSRIQNKIKGELTKNIETQLANGLNNPKVKDKVANSVKKSLASRLGQYKNWKITKVSSNGNNFILNLRN